MANQLATESIYDRYLKLHKQWSESAQLKDHLDALPRLVSAAYLADRIDSIALRLINDMTQAIADSASRD